MAEFGPRPIDSDPHLIEGLSSSQPTSSLPFADKLLETLKTDVLAQILSIFIILTTLMICVKCFAVDQAIISWWQISAASRDFDNLQVTKPKLRIRQSMDDTEIASPSPQGSKFRPLHQQMRTLANQNRLSSPGIRKAQSGELSSSQLIQVSNHQEANRSYDKDASPGIKSQRLRLGHSPVRGTLPGSSKKQKLSSPSLRHMKKSPARITSMIRDNRRAAANFNQNQRGSPASTPIEQYSFLQDPQEASSDPCCICLSPLDYSQPQRTLYACTHTFHSTCLEAWLKQAPISKCPLCKCLLVQV